VTTNTRSNPATASLTQKGGGKTSDRAFSGLALVAGLLVLVILALILIVTVKQSIPVFQKEGLKFFTSSTWIPKSRVNTLSLLGARPPLAMIPPA